MEELVRLIVRTIFASVNLGLLDNTVNSVSNTGLNMQYIEIIKHLYLIAGHSFDRIM